MAVAGFATTSGSSRGWSRARSPLARNSIRAKAPGENRAIPDKLLGQIFGASFARFRVLCQRLLLPAQGRAFMPTSCAENHEGCSRGRKHLAGRRQGGQVGPYLCAALARRSNAQAHPCSGRATRDTAQLTGALAQRTGGTDPSTCDVARGTSVAAQPTGVADRLTGGVLRDTPRQTPPTGFGALRRGDGEPATCTALLGEPTRLGVRLQLIERGACVTPSGAYGFRSALSAKGRERPRSRSRRNLRSTRRTFLVWRTARVSTIARSRLFDAIWQRSAGSWSWLRSSAPRGSPLPVLLRKSPM